MYNYQTQKQNLFTDDGQRMLLKVRDHIQKTIQHSGAITMGCAIQGAGSGHSWDMLACVDRLIELGELREIKQGDVPGQCRIFVSARS